MLYVYCNISAGDDDECMGWPREIFALTSLRRLNLSFHGFRQLPPHVQQLKALEELVISNNPLLESLPGELALLPHIRGLLVRHDLLPLSVFLCNDKDGKERLWLHFWLYFCR